MATRQSDVQYGGHWEYSGDPAPSWHWVDASGRPASPPANAPPRPTTTPAPGGDWRSPAPSQRTIPGYTPPAPTDHATRLQNRPSLPTEIPFADFIGPPGQFPLDTSFRSPSSAMGAGATAEQLDAFNMIQSTLDQYGLGSLADWLWKQIISGVPDSQIFVALRQTPEYIARFPAIEARRRAGLPGISEGEYVAYERSLAQQFQEFGLMAPTTAMTASFLVQDRSVREVREDLEIYDELRTNPYTRREFFAYTGIDPGDHGVMALALGLAPDLERAYQVATGAPPTQAEYQARREEIRARLRAGPASDTRRRPRPTPEGLEGVLGESGATSHVQRLRALIQAKKANEAQFRAGGSVEMGQRPIGAQTF